MKNEKWEKLRKRLEIEQTMTMKVYELRQDIYKDILHFMDLLDKDERIENLKGENE